MALVENRTPDPAPGKNGLLRSRHNNYLTLPVLFIMISNHFPSTYGDTFNWAVLAVISIASVAIRHWFTIRHTPDRKTWILPTAMLLLFVVMLYTAPRTPDVSPENAITTAQVQTVIAQRCTVCHSSTPTQVGFSSPPLGISFDQDSDVETQAARIFSATVTTRVMPPGNLTGITDDERDMITRWYAGLNAE